MRFDTYTFNARLRPALLVLAPAAVGAVAWFPQWSTWAPVLTVLAYCGFTFLLAQIGRDLGKRKELRLFELWDGSPTAKLLRHSTTKFDRHSLARYHSYLAAATGVPAPTVEIETVDPHSADNIYSTYTRHLREVTRGREQFGLLFAENVNYGFRRNLWAMKPAAILLCVIGIASSVAAAHSDVTKSSPIPIVSILFCTIMLVWWCFRITPEWVRLAADEYADRLMGACEVLSARPAPQSPAGSP